MWQSLIQSDLEGIKQSSKALGVEEMYGLLACILTARSWEVITNGGIDQGPVTDDEVCTFVEIKELVIQLTGMLLLCYIKEIVYELIKRLKDLHMNISNQSEETYFYYPINRKNKLNHL